MIGEDLGTVPPGFRDIMAEAGMLGMRVLPFERDGDGAFLPPDMWSDQAIAMTATHDIATVAGCGRAAIWNASAYRRRPVSSEESADRAQERTALWQAIGHDAPKPDEPSEVVDAAIAAVAETPCPLAIVPVEDLLGLDEQPNLPGTIDEHPNWRRRLLDTLDRSLAKPRFRRASP